MRRLVLILCGVCLGLGTLPARADQLPAVRLLVSNPAPYVGEELIVTLEIRTTPRPPGPVTPLWPALDSCAVSDLPPRLPRLEEDDHPVLVQTVQRAVRPLKAGRLTLAAAGMRLTGRVWNAPALDLRVVQLPEKGRPEDFAGAVGAVSMELQESGRGSREIRLILSGVAPLDDFPVPFADLGSGERLIPLDDATTGEADQGRTRTLRYLYLPGDGNRGRLAFHLPLFDPLQRRYIVLQAGIRQLPVWPRRMAYTLCGLAVLAGIGYFIHRRRVPRSLDQALTRLLGRPSATLPRREILDYLQSRGAKEELLSALTVYWNDHDRPRFAPQVTADRALPGPDPREQALLRHLSKLRH